MIRALFCRRVYRVWTIVALAILWGSPLASALAQDGASKPGTTIHVVQRDETLYRIAMRYGTTVEAIADANGISDPRYLAVGQRLLIPNTGTSTAGMVSMHMVSPGETLDALARYYNTTPDTLARANYICNPDLLFAGETITVPVGMEQSTAPTTGYTIYYAEAGDNWARIALRHNLPLRELLRANNLSRPSPVTAHQRIWLPSGDNTTVARDLQIPFTSFALSPIPAIQGKTLSIALTTTEYVTLSGTFMGYPVQLVTQDATRHYALFGIHAFAGAGVYPLVLTATAADGTQTNLIQRIRVDQGGYGAEEISLTTEQQDLLSPQVTEPEWERFARMMSSFTAQRYFAGVMGLPSPGALSSEFGTRRSYNGGVLNTFHSGTDFAGGPGSAVVAPAAGVVILAEHMPVRGNITIIDHGWGVVTAYFHQSEIQVAVGDVVAAGQVIGAIGSTGRSTGPHLHWEMWVGGVQVDAMQWVQRSFP